MSKKPHRKARKAASVPATGTGAYIVWQVWFPPITQPAKRKGA
jgi:hypothetical protein